MFLKFELANGDTRIIADCTGDLTVSTLSIKSIVPSKEDRDCFDVILEDERKGLVRLEEVDTRQSGISDPFDDDDLWVCENIKELQKVLVVVFLIEDWEDAVTAILPIKTQVKMLNENGAVFFEYPSAESGRF